MTEGTLSAEELAAELLVTTELMANFASVPSFELWNRHSNACLAAARELSALKRDRGRHMDAVYNAALPFDNALGEDEPSYPDNTPVTLAFGAVRDFSLTLGDLRRLRAAIQETSNG